MILRQLVIRHGRQVMRQSLIRPARWTSTTTSTPTVDDIESTFNHSIEEAQSIQAQVQALGSEVSVESARSEQDHPVLIVQKLRQLDRENSSGLGSTQTDLYQPHSLLLNPPSPAEVTLELLLASQAHLGHATSLWNPNNSRYIFGIRDGVHIISLEQTAAHLRRACKVVKNVIYRGGLVLFVGTRSGHDTAVVNAAKRAGAYHLFQRWTPGTITNRQQILGDCRKKVINILEEEVPGYQDQLEDRTALKPDLVVCLNPIENYIMLHECGLNGIPTIGIIDTDADPTWVTYPIPANDDSLRCVQVIAGVLGRAGEEGKEARRKAAQEGRVTYTPALDLEVPEDVPIEREDPAKMEKSEASLIEQNNLLPTV